ncbi:MAG: winged helix-turn-helix transcriptional regulator [Anaerolineae bacterium]|nr:winged helix-turn-helix transcriptional regulator [Anaerolineae bacterium]
MPFEVIDTLDSLANLIEFRSSAVYELIISIRTLLKPARWHESFVERVKAALSPALMEELVDLYQNFSDGGLYFEFPVDYPDHDDVPGFFRYMHSLSDADFMFYLLGRTISREELSGLLYQPKSADLLRAGIIAVGEHYEWYGHNLEPIVKDIGAFKQRLIAAWEAYWDAFLQHELPNFQAQWIVGMQEKQSIFAREGGRGLLEKVTGKVQLPPEVPPGVPYTSITFIPVCLLPSRVYQFFGYGNLTILFDPQFTEERRAEVQNAKKDAISILKAMDDETRLQILRLIAQHGSRMHGKNIAEKLGISASAVSRHLALLKDGGLIAEDPRKNLITYRFQKEVLTSLVDKLLDYLYS